MLCIRRNISPMARKSPLSRPMRARFASSFTARTAPIHVGNFVELAQDGFYDGLKFHRYVPGFVIQGGCPNTRDMSAADVAAGKSGPEGMPGTGNPGYSIKGEWKTNPNNSHEDGTLAMARSSMPDSAGSQFYFCLGPQALPRHRLYGFRRHHRGPRRHQQASCW